MLFERQRECESSHQLVPLPRVGEMRQKCSLGVPVCSMGTPSLLPPRSVHDQEAKEGAGLGTRVNGVPRPC